MDGVNGKFYSLMPCNEGINMSPDNSTPQNESSVKNNNVNLPKSSNTGVPISPEKKQSDLNIVSLTAQPATNSDKKKNASSKHLSQDSIDTGEEESGIKNHLDRKLEPLAVKEKPKAESSRQNHVPMNMNEDDPNFRKQDLSSSQLTRYSFDTGEREIQSTINKTLHDIKAEPIISKEKPKAEPSRQNHVPMNMNEDDPNFRKQDLSSSQLISYSFDTGEEEFGGTSNNPRLGGKAEKLSFGIDLSSNKKPTITKSSIFNFSKHLGNYLPPSLKGNNDPVMQFVLNNNKERLTATIKNDIPLEKQQAEKTEKLEKFENNLSLVSNFPSVEKQVKKLEHEFKNVLDVVKQSFIREAKSSEKTIEENKSFEKKIEKMITEIRTFNQRLFTKNTQKSEERNEDLNKRLNHFDNKIVELIKQLATVENRELLPTARQLLLSRQQFLEALFGKTINRQ